MGFDIINRLKKEKGLTNADIARLSGVTISTLDKITSGINTNPKLDTLQAICRVLGCTLNDFMEPQPSPVPEVSNDALKLARDYDGLDVYGKRLVRRVTDTEQQRMREMASEKPVDNVIDSGTAAEIAELKRRINAIEEEDAAKELAERLAKEASHIPR